MKKWLAPLVSGRPGVVAVAVAVLVLTMAPLPAAAAVLVREGEARAVVVTAAEPTPTARYAAEELVAHVRLATGATLPVVVETAVPDGYESRVYLGETRALAALGVETGSLGPDVFVLRTDGDDLYIAGREDPEAEDPLALRNNHWGGTLFGVYELLESRLGVRWLWPGELGTYVPRAETLVIPPLDTTAGPALRFRRFRTGSVGSALRRYQPAVKRLAFSRAGLEAYARDLAVFFRRRRMGDSEPKPPVGHYFSGWWRRHGERHPEWFMMRAGGERGPGLSDDPAHVAMCVSNPDLHRYILEEAWDGGPWLRLGEVDRRVFCQCPECLAWDRPPPDDRPDFAAPLYLPQAVSDRYARFWRLVLEQAVERNPEVTVTTFLYWNYQMPPQAETTLDRRIYGEFVPWGAPEATWYPMSAAADRWLRQLWLGWQATGITMAYRPNHTLAGYAMPHINTWQGGEFLRFAYEHGMVGVDFDSLTGQWAVRGPENYMYFRLFADPTMSIADIRGEYFSAFGPAAAAVERYFDYWEDHNYRLQEEGRWRNIYAHPAGAPGLYPPAIFPPAAAILEEALAAAGTHPRPEYAARVRFLDAGLEHARLSADLVAMLGRPVPAPGSEEFQAARARLEELIAFRRAHEHLYIADYIRLAGPRGEGRYREVIDALLAE